MSSQMSPLTLGSQFDHASSNGLSRPCKRIKCHRPTPSSPSSLVAPSTVSTSAASAVSLIDTQSITNALTMAARNDCPSDNVFQLMRQWTRSPVIAAVARIEEDDVDDDEELDEDEANEMNERTHVDDDEDVEDDLDRDMNGSHSSGSELAGDIKCAKSNLTLGKPSGKSCTTRHLNHKSNRHSRRSLTPNHVQSGNLSRTRTNNFSIDSILTSSQKHSFHLPNPLYNISNVNPFDSSAATTIATRLASIDHFNNSFDSINRLPHHHHHPHHHHLPPLSPFQHLTHLSQLQQLKQQLTHLSPATAAAAAAAAAAAVSLNFHPGSLMTTNASRHPDSNHHLIHHAHSTPTNSDYSDHVNHHSHLLSSRSAAAFVDRFTGTSLPSNQSSSPLDRICSASSVYLSKNLLSFFIFFSLSLPSLGWSSSNRIKAIVKSVDLNQIELCVARLRMQTTSAIYDDRNRHANCALPFSVHFRSPIAIVGTQIGTLSAAS